MPNSAHARLSGIGSALLLLALPACSALPATSDGSRLLPEEESGRVVVSPPAVPERPASTDVPPSTQQAAQAPLDQAREAPLPQEPPAQKGTVPLPQGDSPLFVQPLEAGRMQNEHGPGEAAQGRSATADGDFWVRLQRDTDLCVDDYRHYYTTRNLGALALGFAIAAPLANTHADLSIRRWYQRKVRGETTDEYAQVMNYAGQFWVIVPIGLEFAALMGNADENYPFDHSLWEWSNRSLRAMAVGAPPMMVMYVVLGSSRPDRNNSHWHPFQDVHGVSGHTFVGAVPFLTAAAMTDNPLYKYPLVLGSFLTGWSRINNDRHFFSQVLLGWWMACAAVHSVNETQAERRSYTIGPTWLEDGPGVAVYVQY